MRLPIVLGLALALSAVQATAQTADTTPILVTKSAEKPVVIKPRFKMPWQIGVYQ